MAAMSAIENSASDGRDKREILRPKDNEGKRHLMRTQEAAICGFNGEKYDRINGRNTAIRVPYARDVLIVGYHSCLDLSYRYEMLIITPSARRSNIIR